MTRKTIVRTVDLETTVPRAFEAVRSLARAAQWGIVRQDEQAATLELWAPGAPSQGRAQTTVEVQVTAGNPDGSLVQFTGSTTPVQFAPQAQLRRLVEPLVSGVRDPHARQRLAAPRSPAQKAVSLLLTVVVVAAILIATEASVPQKVVNGVPVRALPSIALGNVAIYRLEIGLAVLYGGLLILTPLYRGIVRGTLPIEVSARGAKFSDQVDDLVEKIEGRVETLEDRANELSTDLIRLRGTTGV